MNRQLTVTSAAEYNRVLYGDFAILSPRRVMEPKPIHSIPYSVAQPLDRGYKNYYSIIQGNRQGFLSLSKKSKRTFLTS